MKRCALLLLVGCTRAPAPHTEVARAPVIAESPHTALGVPRDGDPSDDVILDRRWFVVSYNPGRSAPNWVAWKLEASDLGPVKRTNKFHADDELGSGILRIEPSDFLRSGYDRGHLCPSGDRTASPEMNHATFVMTNMLAQTHDLNAGPWEALESFSRDEARKGKVLHIVAGGLFSAAPKTIGRGVAVAERVFKVAIELEGAAPKSALAFVMPNQAGIAARDFAEYATSVDEVERESGYDFFANLPDEVENMLESQVWRRP